MGTGSVLEVLIFSDISDDCTLRSGGRLVLFHDQDSICKTKVVLVLHAQQFSIYHYVSRHCRKCHPSKIGWEGCKTAGVKTAVLWGITHNSISLIQQYSTRIFEDDSKNIPV